MSKFLCSLAAAAGLAFFGLAAAPALAQSPVTFVSGKGTDAGNCAAPASPCRTFQYAHGLTNPGGEIKALDPANYFSLFINKSINVTGVEGAGIIRGTAGDAIIINAGASGKVLLRNLSLDGFGVANNGIKITSAGSVEIVNCAVRSFTNRGISAQPSSGTLKLFIADTLVSKNEGHGIGVFPSGSATVKGLVKRVTLGNNGFSGLFMSGFTTTGRADMTVFDSAAEENAGGFSAVSATDNANATLLLDHVAANGNAFDGLSVAERAVGRITRSTFTRNLTGIKINNAPFAKVESFGDNAIRDPIDGALTPVAQQ